MEQLEGQSASAKQSSPRRDIAWKIFLRMFRRFFYRLFKEDNPKIWSMRLNKVTFDTQLAAVRQFVLKHFNEDSEELALYFLRMFGWNCIDNKPLQYQSEFEGKAVNYTGKVFAKSRYNAIHHSSEFRRAFLYFYAGTLPNVEDRCYDLFLDTEASNMTKHLERYTDVIEEMYSRCINFSSEESKPE